MRIQKIFLQTMVEWPALLELGRHAEVESSKKVNDMARSHANVISRENPS